METEKPGASLKSKESTPEERSAAASKMGKVSNDKKTAAAKENGKLAPPGPGRTPRPILDYPCTCGAGDSLEGHKTTCPRGYAIYRRRRAGTLKDE